MEHTAINLLIIVLCVAASFSTIFCVWACNRAERAEDISKDCLAQMQALYGRPIAVDLKMATLRIKRVKIKKKVGLGRDALLGSSMPLPEVPSPHAEDASRYSGFPIVRTNKELKK